MGSGQASMGRSSVMRMMEVRLIMVERGPLGRRLTISAGSSAFDEEVIGLSMRATSRTRGAGRVYDQMRSWISVGRRENWAEDERGWIWVDMVDFCFVLEVVI